MSSIGPSVGKSRSKVCPVFFNRFPDRFDSNVAIDDGMICRNLNGRNVRIYKGLVLNRLEGTGTIAYCSGLDIG